MVFCSMVMLNLFIAVILVRWVPFCQWYADFAHGVYQLLRRCPLLYSCRLFCNRLYCVLTAACVCVAIQENFSNLSQDPPDVNISDINAFVDAWEAVDITAVK